MSGLPRVKNWKDLQFTLDKIQEAIAGETRFHSGTGTPEGNEIAPVGHIYLRDDGGANTTLYVKESGAGNTGWVAK